MRKKPNLNRPRLALDRTEIKVLDKGHLREVAGGGCTDHCQVHTCGLWASQRNCCD